MFSKFEQLEINANHPVRMILEGQVQLLIGFEILFNLDGEICSYIQQVYVTNYYLYGTTIVMHTLRISLSWRKMVVVLL